MTLREMNVAVFEGRPIPHVFFQPRFEPWYAWHRDHRVMPARYAGMSLPQLYDYCHASMRTVNYYTGCPYPIERIVAPEVKVHEHWSGDRTELTIRYETPVGDLVERHERTIDGPMREVEFPVKDADDLRKLTWLFRRITWKYDKTKWQQGQTMIGDRGEGHFWVPKSPYQALAQQWMKLENLIYALADCPGVVEDAMKAIDESYDSLYDQLAAARQPRILNFGENIHEQLCSPQYFEEYFLPFYGRRCGQLHAAGIFTHVHIDGYFNHMLKYLRLMPHHGIEALTPIPQGDMTLDAIREHIGDKIALDLIPAVLFLDTYSRDELMACVEKIVGLFYPRLILGVSDEVPEGCGEEGIERVKMIGEWCLTHGSGKSETQK